MYLSTVEKERDTKAKKQLQAAIKAYTDLESNLKTVFEVCSVRSLVSCGADDQRVLL